MGGETCGNRFLTGPCIREPGHPVPHRDASGCEWRGVSSVDFQQGVSTFQRANLGIRRNPRGR